MFETLKCYFYDGFLNEYIPVLNTHTHMSVDVWLNITESPVSSGLGVESEAQLQCGFSHVLRKDQKQNHYNAQRHNF